MFTHTIDDCAAFCLRRLTAYVTLLTAQPISCS